VHFILGICRTPDVYTQFRKRVEAQAPVRKCLDMPECLKPLPQGIDEGDIPTHEDLGVEGNYMYLELHVEKRRRVSHTCWQIFK
jgi:hypothetical protein